MRAEYFSTRERAVNLPDFIPSCSSGDRDFFELEGLDFWRGDGARNLTRGAQRGIQRDQSRGRTADQRVFEE